MGTTRDAICEHLGFKELPELHQFVVKGIKGDGKILLKRGLSASILAKLGYTEKALRGLGASPESMQTLLGSTPKNIAPTPEPEEHRPDPVRDVEKCLEQKLSYGEMRTHGITAAHCRKAGADVTLLVRLGFPLVELCRFYSIRDLKRAGFKIRDLGSHVDDSQLKAAGYTAIDMRVAGRTIKQLQQAGYSDNQIRTAGFSINDMAAAGLSKQTQDFIKGV